MRHTVVAVLLLASCYNGNYRGFIGQRVHFTECLDLAVAPSSDAVAPGRVLAYTFGNRCVRDVRVDLSAVRAVGRYSDGLHPMRALDPHHELRPLRLEGLDSATEQIAYAADDGSKPTAMCVDVGAVEPSEHPIAHWLCFGAWDLGSELGVASAATETRSASVAYPMSSTPEPEVATIPDSSIAATGKYLAARITDKTRLVKALHDFVALRIRYDDYARTMREAGFPAPAQDAESVYGRRAGVCEGYSRLMVALGEAAGVDIRYIDGDALDDDTGAPIAGNHFHAWNAVDIDGRWALMDVTWDRSATGELSTTYLFTPPGQFAATHRPSDPQWSFVAPALTLDELVARPWGAR